MANSTYTREDGTTYFVIGSGTSADSAHLVVVDTIAERNTLANTGMVLVRNAYLADETVHRGWALYIVDPDSLNTSPHTWIKIAEQESVDGPWGVNEELLSVLVQTKDFTEFKNEINTQLANYNALFNQISTIESNSHSHTNKAVLDKLTVEAGVLKYDSRTIGSTYIYDDVDSDQGIFWENPTDSTDRIAVASSLAIANKLIENNLVSLGQAIRVTEIDKSVSEYVVAKDASGVVKAFFRGRIGGNNDSCNVVHFTNALPSNASAYYGQGFWYLIKSDGTNLPGKFYTVVLDGTTYKWANKDSVVPTPAATVKPEILTCFKTSIVDLGTTVKIAWKDPALTSGTNNDVKWHRTVVVRRFGTAPTSHSDGTVVVETDTHDEYATKCFIDAIPFVKQKAYYGVFSQTVDGVWYLGATAEATLPSWEYFKTQVQKGLAALNFEVGDTVILPSHETYGIMEYEVTKTESDGDVYLTAKCALGNMVYDGREYGMVPTADETYQAGKTYYRVESSDTSHQQFYQLEENRDYVVGDSCAGKFEMPVNPVYDASTGIIHGSYQWPHANLKLWLNSDSTNWFTAQSVWDKQGFEQTKGFLAGFSDANFKACIRSVLIPDSTTGNPSTFIKTLTTGASCIWWTMTTDATNNKVKVYGADGAESYVFPETENIAVVPVIQLGSSVVS